MSDNVIEFHNASMWYGEVIALNEVSFKFTPGVTGLVGSNGAGKTTAIKLAASLLRPTLGHVTINNEDIWQNYEYLKTLGYSPEIDRQFDFLTGRKFLEWSSKLQGLGYGEMKKKVDEVLSRIGMTHAANRPINGYSRGMRQRVKVGQALLHEPQILLADEPLSGTDPIGRNLLVTLFQELAHDDNVTIIVSSHVLHELERVSDEIIVLNDGKLVAEGRIADVRMALSRIPQRIQIKSDDIIRLSKLIVDQVSGVTNIDAQTIEVNVKNRNEFAEILAQISKENNLDIYEMAAKDQDLTSLFKIIKSQFKAES